MQKGAIPVSAGQLYRFVYEVKIGDLVAYPSRSDHRIYIAQVTGEYFYSVNHKRSYPHQPFAPCIPISGEYML